MFELFRVWGDPRRSDCTLATLNLVNSVTMADAIKRWEPVDGIDSPCAEVDFVTSGQWLILVLRFSLVIGDCTRDLRLQCEWGDVVGFTSWQELAHLCREPAFEGAPKLGDPWADYAFPVLELCESGWLTDVQCPPYSNLRHFRIITLDHTVDLLTTSEPHAEWLPGGEGLDTASP